MTAARAADRRGAGAADYVSWLSLAASPTFAVMTALAAIGGGPMERLCASAGRTPLNGMAVMYLLMGVFHAPPWLRLIRHRRAR